VRDALSLLDQGIAHGGDGGVTALAIRDMLGLSDRGEIIALFERVMKGEIVEALEIVRTLHHAGADAADILIELAEFCHFVTRAKITPAATEDPAVSEVERERAQEFAEKLTLGVLARAWQILLKGVEDVKDSPRPLASAEMALIRLAYASDLPTPEEALRKLSQATDGPRHAPPLPSSGGGPRASMRLAAADSAPAASPSPATPSVAAPRPASFSDVVALARSKRDIQLVQSLERDVRLARFEQGSIAFTLVDGAQAGLAQTLSRRLQEWTGERWMVALVAGSTTPTLRETADAREAERTTNAASHPLVQKVLDRFKGARIVDVRRPEAAPSPPAPPAGEADDEVGYADSGVDPADDV
jgi:DNA polymerase-3 subunit gamma/tau